MNARLLVSRVNETLVMSSSKDEPQDARGSTGSPRAIVGSGSERWPLLVPAAAKRTVDFDKARALAQLGLRQTELRVEETRVGVEHLEVAGHTAFVPHLREPARILRGAEQQGLLLAKLTQLAVANERIRHLAKRLTDRLLIGDRRLFAARLGKRHLRSRTAGGEDRHRRGRGRRPNRVGRREQRHQRCALESTRASQRDLRKVRRAGN